MFENGKIYDKKSNVTWPNGETQTADELRGSAEWRDMFERPYILCTDDRGVTTHFFELEAAKDSFGIDESDPEKALEAIKAAEAKAVERARKDVELYNSALDTSMNAVAELGVMTATGMESAAELGTMTATSMESVAELGGTVAALEARIAALEAAQA